MQSTLAEQMVPVERFNITAWETISKGGLLLGLKPTEISDLLQVYSLVYRANDFSAQLLDSATGVKSALNNAPQITKIYKDNLQTTLVELQAALSKVADK